MSDPEMALLIEKITYELRTIMARVPVSRAMLDSVDVSVMAPMIAEDLADGFNQLTGFLAKTRVAGTIVERDESWEEEEFPRWLDRIAAWSPRVATWLRRTLGIYAVRHNVVNHYHICPHVGDIPHHDHWMWLGVKSCPDLETKGEDHG